MPFQPINFAYIQPHGNPLMRNLVEDLIGSFSSGYNLSQMPAAVKRQREQEELRNAFDKLRLNEKPQVFKSKMQGMDLANALNKLRLQQEPERFSSEISSRNMVNALNKARLNEINKRMSLPFGGDIAPGSVGQAMWVDMIKQYYGPDSEQAMRAEESYKTDLAKTQYLNEYRNALSGTAEKRAATPLAKTEQEVSDIKLGFVPGTGRRSNLSEEEQEEMLGRYSLKRQKDISDSDARKRALFASNIDKTLEQINVDDLTQYAGFKGGLSKAFEESRAPLGKESNNYRDYQKSLSAAKLLKKQVRQFYGDSITPEMQKSIEELTNPATWKNNPEIAKQNFNVIKNILQKETSTYREGIKSTKEFESQKKDTTDWVYNPKSGNLEKGGS